MSGAQNWNGTAETLNANPTTTNRIATCASVSLGPVNPPSLAAIACSSSAPVSP